MHSQGMLLWASKTSSIKLCSKANLLLESFKGSVLYLLLGVYELHP